MTDKPVSKLITENRKTGAEKTDCCKWAPKPQVLAKNTSASSSMKKHKTIFKKGFLP